MTSKETLLELVTFIKKYVDEPRPIDIPSFVEPNSYAVGKNDAISEIMKKIIELAKK